MTIEITTTPGRVASRQRVDLDGVTYSVRLHWLARAATWALDLSADDGTPLATGLALRANTPTTLHLRHRAGMPRGSFVVVDTSSALGDPTFDDLGSRVRLLYVTAAEVAA